eukprot:2444916-Prymnesium_polylepis.1
MAPNGTRRGVSPRTSFEATSKIKRRRPGRAMTTRRMSFSSLGLAYVLEYGVRMFWCTDSARDVRAL